MNNLYRSVIFFFTTIALTAQHSVASDADEDAVAEVVHEVADEDGAEDARGGDIAAFLAFFSARSTRRGALYCLSRSAVTMSFAVVPSATSGVSPALWSLPDRNAFP